MSPDTNDKKKRRRSDYPFFLSYRTRWFAPLPCPSQFLPPFLTFNRYDALFTSIIHCGLAPTQPDADGNQIGLVVSSFCEFFSPLSFPDVLDLGLRVAQLGRSSVTYEVGVFKSLGGNEISGCVDAPAAVGGYTHVLVDKHSRKSVTMNTRMRVGFEKLVAITRPSSGAKL
ncbi:thioesterase [Lanmaoa asiatica]|nr:thioesterase [Lanmaoa asiatica]